KRRSLDPGFFQKQTPRPSKKKWASETPWGEQIVEVKSFGLQRIWSTKDLNANLWSATPLWA
ncbi:MAG: hypothetical protein ACK53V_18900, partial [Planctomycetota bacterium]